MNQKLEDESIYEQKSSKMPLFILKMIDPMEKPLKNYSGNYEVLFYLYSVLFFAFYRILDFSENFSEEFGISIIDAPFKDGLGFMIYEVSFTTFAYLTIIALATKDVQKWVNNSLKKNQGRSISLFFPIVSIIYFVGAQIIGFTNISIWSDVLSVYLWDSDLWIIKIILVGMFFYIGLQTTINFALLRKERVNLFTLLKKGLSKKGKTDKVLFHFCIYFIFLLLISPFIVLIMDLEQLSWLAALAPLAIFLLFFIAKIPYWNKNEDGFTFGDTLTVGIGVGIIILFQPIFPLTWCYTLPIAAILMMNTTKLGREHFYFSFVPRSGKEFPELINLVLFSIFFFIPVAYLVNFIEINVIIENSDISGFTLIKNMGIWIFLTGTAEEIIFRCGVLILVRDIIVRKTKNKDYTGFMAIIKKRPALTSMLIAAIVFGVSHIPKGLNYGFLAGIAGILYGIPFVKYKNLFGPIILHAVVDVIAVAYFNAPL